MQVQVDDKRLLLEEEYIGRRWLVLIMLVFAVMGLAPGVVILVREGSVLGLAIGTCLLLFIFYLPFLVVLALSRYRRVEIDRVTGNVESRVVYRLWRSVSRRFPAQEVETVVCERVADSEGRDQLRIRLRCRSGEVISLVNRAGWSDDVVGHLRDILGDKVIVE